MRRRTDVAPTRSSGRDPTAQAHSWQTAGAFDGARFGLPENGLLTHLDKGAMPQPTYTVLTSRHRQNVAAGFLGGALAGSCRGKVFGPPSVLPKKNLQARRVGCPQASLGQR